MIGLERALYQEDAEPQSVPDSSVPIYTHLARDTSGIPPSRFGGTVSLDGIRDASAGFSLPLDHFRHWDLQVPRVCGAVLVQKFSM